MGCGGGADYLCDDMSCVFGLDPHEDCRDTPCQSCTGWDDKISTGYSYWQLMTVKQIVSVNGIDGYIPIILLPKSLIGKTVKVTIKEQL